MQAMKAWAWAVLGLVASCSGKAIVDGPVGNGGSGGSGGGAGSGTTTTSWTTTSTTGTGTSGCDDHADCPGGVCIFSSGTCSTSCSFFEPCGPGEVCDECATSSCPECYDCVAACVPAPAGVCDDHDDCVSGEVCVYGLGECWPACMPTGGCEQPNLVCDPCATSSCPGCEDCLGACMPY